MTLNQLVCRAASAYPDAFVMEYWDALKEVPMKNPDGGDTLAEFVALELYESFDPEAGDDEQLATAVKVMLTPLLVLVLLKIRQRPCT